MFSPAWCHLHSCVLCVCWKDGGGYISLCMCICVTSVPSLHVFALLCFVVYLIFTTFIACGYHCFCIGTKMHHVLNISLTSIHLIQLPHPWMQWLWPYQWEILTTQKVGQIENPPSVCPSSLSLCPPRALCPICFVEDFTFHFGSLKQLSDILGNMFICWELDLKINTACMSEAATSS